MDAVTQVVLFPTTNGLGLGEGGEFNYKSLIE